MELFRANEEINSSINNTANLSGFAFINPQQLNLVPAIDITNVVAPTNEHDTNEQWYCSPQRDTLLHLNEAALQTESLTSECTPGCQEAALRDKISAINSTVTPEYEEVDSVIADDETSIDDETTSGFKGFKRKKRHRPMNKDEQLSTIASLRQKLKDFPPVQPQLEIQSHAPETTIAAVPIKPPSRELPCEEQTDYSLFNISPCKTTKKRGRKSKDVDETASMAHGTIPASLPQKKHRKSSKHTLGNKAKYEKVFNTKVLDTLDTLRSMRDHTELGRVVSFACEVLAKQENSQEAMKQLVDIEMRYKEANKQVFEGLVALLDHYGAIPKGGLDS